MIRLILLSLSLVLSAHAADEHGHNHEAAVEPAPHGGVLRDALPHKAELVLNQDDAKVYLYTKSGEKLVPAKTDLKELKGRIQLPKDKKETPVTFSKKGEAYEAKIAGISKVHRYDLHLTIPEKGKNIVIDFGVDNIH